MVFEREQGPPWQGGASSDVGRTRGNSNRQPVVKKISVINSRVE